MRKHIGLLFVLMGAGGVLSLLLGFTIGIGILNLIGFVLLLLSALAGLINNALRTDEQDPNSWTYIPDAGLQPPTKDKSQLPFGGYSSGQR
jgi:hypothetical protein